MGVIYRAHDLCHIVYQAILACVALDRQPDVKNLVKGGLLEFDGDLEELHLADMLHSSYIKHEN
jgi:hypothetical protein